MNHLALIIAATVASALCERFYSSQQPMMGYDYVEQSPNYHARECQMHNPNSHFSSYSNSWSSSSAFDPYGNVIYHAGPDTDPAPHRHMNPVQMSPEMFNHMFSAFNPFAYSPYAMPLFARPWNPMYSSLFAYPSFFSPSPYANAFLSGYFPAYGYPFLF
ncbi:uncharacterized protein MONOS_1406 [Monocercomonoides exilis]|uniref:uncharacterized protein n=1 Tax=Monocercomonoides exilis TaxID=2049356 RepID=UPI00355A1B7D|nr:hypothetical protein MONOS_1406 [Monocercomonoides exilis]|eukprot:MONOS_1406.1-p1 / transcript=MONOS_1406.1 / gene=MONOS_1406 / organism=Monocercomonoides_exilis_PA203 / gene_product=unspecified product / transcript_product=unspecified product / location=Mono_scaffold00024:160602-161081(-) / protein_length=160 / sequence_SO=supercontig / SO=protein_coding / is_pseudo=false